MNSFQSVVSSFRRLKEEEDFVDVTLACNSKQFTAHKVVLSACSPYFRRLLKVRYFIFNFYAIVNLTKAKNFVSYIGRYNILFLPELKYEI